MGSLEKSDNNISKMKTDFYEQKAIIADGKQRD